ncbi:tripartite tricarboxylate transporter substrate-binding protein [Variovorax sp. GB1P17]|uniref:tripartite tricarboxylate transporter substrate-binding protein n=1 Tax=Variovorax sp. GB1P17 TaxID=3443740 RepID=UPI003F45EF83
MTKAISLWAGILASTALLVLAPPAALAQQADTWPAKPITWIVGFPPGGTVDVLTRVAAEQLAKKTGQSVVVDNRPGAAGAIALKAAARSAPDGTTLITVPGPILFPRPEPEIGTELAPVMQLADGPMILVGPASQALPSLKDVISEAKKNPAAWSYASSGNGTGQHLAGELLNQMAGVKMAHIPYKGGSAALNDVLGGQVPLAILGSSTVLPFVLAGKLKAYAVTTPSRIASLPNVPTFAESGFAGYEATQWFAVAVPAKTPAATVQKLNAALREIVTLPAFRKAVDAAGMDPRPGSPADLQGFVSRDSRKWKDLVQKSGLSLE